MEPVRVSFCYAREDERLRNELDRHLGLLKRSGRIVTWYDRKILPGTNFEKEINDHLKTSDVILLLVSTHFLDSEYCYSIEMQRALAMHEAGLAHVIPILLRHVDWKTTPLGKLQVLPLDGKPLAAWQNRDAAMASVVRDIRPVINAVSTGRLAKEADSLTTLPQRERQDLAVIGPDGQVVSWTGVSLEDEKQYEVIEQVLSLDSLNVAALHWKGSFFFRQEKYQEALAVFASILQLDPHNALAHRKKGRCLFELGNYEEALKALDAALRLRPNDLNASFFQGHALSALHCHEKALAIFEQILQRTVPDNLFLYPYIAQELRFLGRVTEAEHAEFIHNQRHRRRIIPSGTPIVPPDGNHPSLPSSRDRHQPRSTNPRQHHSQSISRPHQLSQEIHKPPYQSAASSTKQLRPAQHLKQGLRISSLKTVVSFMSLVFVVAAISLSIHWKNTSVSASSGVMTPTPPDFITPEKALPGQMWQVIGKHFPSGQTVFVTLEGQPQGNNGATAYTSPLSALNLPLVSLLSRDVGGTPVAVQADGTFTIAVLIPMSWAGGIHHLTVSNQAGRELGSLRFVVGDNQPTPTTPIPTPTNGTVIVTPQTPTPAVASSATVTITPVSQQLNHTFTITGVTGTPSGQQVQARVLRATTGTYSQTVPATGHGTTQGTSATGTVYISNVTSASVIIFGYNIYHCNGYDTGCSQLHVVVNQAVYLSAHQSNKPVAASIQEVGTAGNGANSSNFVYEDNQISLVAGSFTGGTDPQPYTYVLQSDITNAANGLISAHQPDAQQAQQVLQGQAQANERFVVSTSQCTANTPNADHQMSDHATTFTISVNFTCTSEVYDYDGALSLAEQLLRNQAANDPGSAYALTGQIVPNLQSASPNGQTVSLKVTAKGVWVYQISITQQQAWARSIAGQSLQAARTLLTGQSGISQVGIQVAEANAQVLPTNWQKITVAVQTVPGL